MNTFNDKLKIFTGGIVATNSFFFDGILIDAGSGVHDWLVENKLTVTHLLITHQHFDHVGDAKKIVDKFACPVYAWQEYDRDLTLVDVMASFFHNFKIDSFTVSEKLQGKDFIEIGDRKIKIIHLAGHSPDSVVFFLSEEKVVFSGDTLFKDSIGRTDFPHSDHDLLISNIKNKLFPLSTPASDVTVFNGHGEQTSMEYEKKHNLFLR